MSTKIVITPAIKKSDILDQLVIRHSNCHAREVVTLGAEHIDLFAWRGTRTVLYVVITTEEEFRAEFSKRNRQAPIDSVGAEKYFVCPYRMIENYEIPKGWGLIYAEQHGSDGLNLVTVVNSSTMPCDLRKEKDILLSILSNR